MSNVSLTEIAELCAEGFDTSITVMRRPRQGNYAAWPIPLKARAAAVYLARRHTRTSYANLITFFCAGSIGSNDYRRIADLAENFAALRAADPRTAEIVEWVESEIDRIHDKRTGAVKVCA